MAWDGTIPYLNGEPMVYAEGWDGREAEWRENTPFDDTLTFLRFSRGRSAARAVFESKHLGCSVEMFLSTFGALVPHVEGGVLKGTWRFQKVGMNFGIVPVEFP